MNKKELKEFLDSIIKCPYCSKLFTIFAGLHVANEGYDYEKMRRKDLPKQVLKYLEDENENNTN